MLLLKHLLETTSQNFRLLTDTINKTLVKVVLFFNAASKKPSLDLEMCFLGCLGSQHLTKLANLHFLLLCGPFEDEKAPSVCIILKELLLTGVQCDVLLILMSTAAHICELLM